MSKAASPETLSDGPRKHFGETLPDLRAEQGKKLPTGSAKLIAIDAAKEIGKLGYDLVKSGGLLTPVKLVTLAWTAWKVYSTAKAEALRKLNETYLTGRDVWAQDIMGNVEGGEFNVSGNEPVKQDIRDYLHGTPPAPSSPLRETVRTQYRKQKEYEAVIASLEKMEGEASAVAEEISVQPPSQEEVATRAKALASSFDAGQRVLQQTVETFDESVEASTVSAVSTEERARWQSYADNPLTLTMFLAYHVASSQVPIAGLRKQPVERPKLIDKKYAHPGGYSRIDGTVQHGDTTVVFNNVLVDGDGHWISDREFVSRIKITTAQGTMDLIEQGDSRPYFHANGRYYDYHSGTADSAHVGQAILKALEAVSTGRE